MKERKDLFEDDQGVFMISVAAELAGMHPQTLRVYEARGLIKPRRSPKQTRLYSQRDVERLRRIHELTTQVGMNLAGVERVLALEELMEAMQRQLERWSSGPRRCSARCEQIDQVHRSYGASSCRGSRPAMSGRRCAAARIPIHTDSEQQTRTTDEPDKFTIKSQEAIQAAQRLAHDRSQPGDHARAPARGAPRAGGRHRRADPAQGRRTRRVRPRASRTRRSTSCPRSAARPRPRRGPSGELVRVFQAAESEAAGAAGRVHLDRAPAARAGGVAGRRPRRSCSAPARRRDAILAALQRGARPAPRHRPQPRGQVPGARALRPRPHRARGAGQARPGDRPRRGDPARDPGAVAAHQEQPRADRRPRRRQDRDRRGPRPADRRRATCPSRCATGASSRSTSAR